VRKVLRRHVVDTCLYSAVQLQPRWLFAQTWGGLAEWFKAHVCSFPELLGERRFGMVFLGIQLRYEEQLGFFDADEIAQEVTVRCLRGGGRVHTVSRYWGQGRRAGSGRPAAQVSCLLCPVAIVEADSLAASPAAFDERIQSCFTDAETAADLPTRSLPGLLEPLKAGAMPLLGTRDGQFSIHRHMSEVADQWSFAELPCIAESAREELVFGQLPTQPELGRALAQGLRSVDIELSRPYFAFDHGVIRTRAFGLESGEAGRAAQGESNANSRLQFWHQLGATLPGAQAHAIVLERY
jgi:hypothetical protein